jgi:hypothetical protein
MWRMETSGGLIFIVSVAALVALSLLVLAW